MEEFKGTKGKWDYCPTEINPNKHVFSVLAEYTGEMVADIYLKRDWDEKTIKSTFRPDVSEANAQLIAAAPELLGALQYAMKLKDLWTLNGIVAEEHTGEAQALNKMYNKIDSAIKKALGQ